MIVFSAAILDTIASYKASLFFGTLSWVVN